MRAAVREQQNIKYQLQQELNELASGVNQADRNWNDLTTHINNTLTTGVQRTKSSHEIAVDAYEMQLEIEKMYALFKNIELANKKIRACKNKMYYEFANYRAVRKIVEAMLNNIEIAFVHESTIMKAVEKKHLQLPDYWLTCALLAIMGWKNDDKELADRALERAMMLDKKATSMFFFAFHIRIGKHETAYKWFREFSGCDYTGEDTDSMVLLFAIANRTIKEECSDEIISGINEFIRKVISDKVEAEDFSEDEVVARVLNYVYGFRARVPFGYPLLGKYCTEKDLLVRELISAHANEKILEFILQTVNITSEEKNDYIHRHIDRLIARSNTAEKDMVNEIRYNELIIEKGGEIEAAKTAYEEERARNENELNIVTEMVDMLYKDNVKDDDPAIAKSMFTLTKDYSEKAVDLYTDGYRKEYRRNVGIKINDYVSQADLSSRGSEDGKIDSFYQKKAADLAAQIKMLPAIVAFGAAALCVVGAIFLNPAIFAVLAVLAAGAGAVLLLLTQRKKKNCFTQCEAEAKSAKAIFDQLVTEFAAYDGEYAEFDALYDRIKEEFAKL